MPYAKAKQKIQQERKCNIVQDKKIGENEDFEFYICPCSLINEKIFSYIQMTQLFKKGVMPFSGGYLEQPAPIIELIEKVNILLDEEEQRQMKKSSK
jgi:hypothetical protein